MKKEDLLDWQKRMRWTQAKAADELGISIATYKRYLTGEVPKVVGLACKYLAIQQCKDERGT